jgi:hypothetical protein
MAITIDWSTRVISVPKADMTLIQASPEIRELDLDVFRLTLKDIEDSDDGMVNPDTHKHSTETTLGGITYARVIEIINGYTVTFEDGQYAVNLVGANSNVGDVVNLNQVSVRSANSAGLIVVTSGSGLSTEEHDALMALDTRLPSDPADQSEVDAGFAAIQAAIAALHDLSDTEAADAVWAKVLP